MNVLFFVDLITFYLKHLNTFIAKENSECMTENVSVVKKMRTADAVRKRLSKIKFTHYCLWKVTQQINDLFGWALITILLQSFFEFVYITKWQLRMLNERMTPVSTIRTSI